MKRGLGVEGGGKLSCRLHLGDMSAAPGYCAFFAFTQTPDKMQAWKPYQSIKQGIIYLSELVEAPGGQF